MAEMSKTCLVTGCAGFVGSHLTEALLKAGHKVVGVDSMVSGNRVNLSGVVEHPRFHFREDTITNETLLHEIVDRWPALSTVFHLGAIVSVPLSFERPEETKRVNLDATLLLHENVRSLGLESFVFAGSAAEYGDCAELPIKEECADTVEQLSPYGRTKYLASKYIQQSGFGCSLRFFNIYGPRQDPTNPYSGVISHFANLALSNAPMVIHGDGSQSRDFIYMDDVVRAYMLAAGLEGNRPLHGVFNVASGLSVSIRELAEIIGRTTGSSGDMRFTDARQGDVAQSWADVSRFHAATGFETEVDLSDGLARTLKWYQANMADDEALVA